MVVTCKSICRTYDARESTRKRMDIPLYLVNWLASGSLMTKPQAKSLDDRGSVGNLLDIDIWDYDYVGWCCRSMQISFDSRH